MEQPASHNMRWIAVAVTAVALLAISIPFVWQDGLEAERGRGGRAWRCDRRCGARGIARERRGRGVRGRRQAREPRLHHEGHGRQVRVARVVQGQGVLLNFWATWCGPCKAEIPGFVELQEKYGDTLAIVGYSVDDTADKAKAFATEYKINYPILLGEGREDVQDAYGPIWGIPASFLISKDGKVCKKHLGIAPKNVFDKEIAALM